MKGDSFYRRLTWAWQKKEAFIWLIALLVLAFTNPLHHYYTLCPFNNLGFEWCPGCGLGRSIGYLFRGDIISSFYSHPLGIPVLGLLIYRIVQIFSRQSYHYSFT